MVSVLIKAMVLILTLYFARAPSNRPQLPEGKRPTHVNAKDTVNTATSAKLKPSIHVTENLNQESCPLHCLNFKRQHDEELWGFLLNLERLIMGTLGFITFYGIVMLWLLSPIRLRNLFRRVRTP